MFLSRPRERILQVLLETHSVGDAGQVVEMSQMPELLLGQFLVRNIPPEKEMPLLRLRPDTRPREDQNTSVLVQIAGFKVAGVPARSRAAHLGAGIFEIVRVNKR